MRDQLTGFDALGQAEDRLVDRGGKSDFPSLLHDIAAEGIELRATSLIPVLQHRHPSGGLRESGQNGVQKI